MSSPLNREEALRIASEQSKIDLAEYEADVQRSLEANRTGNASGRDAIKATTLVNGGAAVAMLAFLGHLASIGADPTTIIEFARALRWFVIGTLLCVLASGITYVAQRTCELGLRREFESKAA